MELWIRSSQRKNLIQCKALAILEGKDVYANDKKCHEYDKYIICELWNNGVTPLGTYKTKERALEVLDEIQKMFYNNQKYINDVVVYQMPED